MPEAVIVDAIRTPIGRAVKGSLKDVRADDLAAVPLKALVDRNPEVDFGETNDVMMGCGFQAGEQGANVGRNAQLLAGIDHHVPATTVNRFCASSLQTIRMAFHAIKAGEGDQYIAAGVEAVSRFPAAEPWEFHPKLNGSEGSLFDVYIPMGMTAENVAERCKVSREAQDEWAATSQQRAVAARDGGHFDAEIVAVTTPDGTEVTRDDGPRPGTTTEKLAELKPAFKPDGHGHRRQRLPAQRRRRRRARDVRGAREGARRQAARPHHRVLGRRDPARDHGPRPDPRGQGRARAGRHDDRRHRRPGAQRGLRRPGRPLPRRVGHRSREAQPVRRRDRARPPVRHDRRAHHDDAAQQSRRARWHDRPGDDVRRRRDGPGDDRGRRGC